MTRENLLSIVKERVKDKTEITEAMINTAIDSVDAAAIIAGVVADYEIVIWDEKSPINGAAAELVLASPPHNLEGWKGLTYLINHSGATRYLQPNDYEAQGWTPIETEARAKELAGKQIQSIAEEGVVSAVVSKLRGE